MPRRRRQPQQPPQQPQTDWAHVGWRPAAVRAEQQIRAQVNGRAPQVNWNAQQPAPQNTMPTVLSLDAQNEIRRQNQQRARNGQRPLSNSERLRVATRIDTGVRGPGGTQAHHVAPSGSRMLQDIFRNANVNPNAAFNNRYLPRRETDDTGDATVHNGSHTRDYNRSIENQVLGRISQIPGNLPPRQHRRAVEYAIGSQITWAGNVLQNRQVPLNSNNDVEYNPNTGNPYTAREIFEEEMRRNPPR